MSERVAAWFASGRIVDLVIAVIVVEALVLVARHRLAGRGPAPASILPNLAAGLALALALRAALAGAAWPWLAAALLAAGVAHLIDLGLRIRRT